MELTAGRNDLAQAVVNAAGGIPPNPIMPVRAGMHILAEEDHVRFTGSDGDTTFTAKCPAASAGKCEVVVPGRLFADVVRSLSGEEAVLVTEGPNLVLKSGRSRFTFRTLEEEYPLTYSPAKECGTLDGEAFADAIKRTSFAAAKTAADPALTAILLEAGEELSVVATDRYKLAAVTCKWLEGDWHTLSALVPARAAERFARGISGEVSLGWDERVCTLRSGDFEMTARILIGKFPNWRSILPEDEPSVPVNAKELTAAVKRAQLASENDSPVALTFRDNNLVVEASGSSGQACEVLAVEYDFADFAEFHALFGIQNLLDGLSACGEECTMGFTEALRPVYIYSGTYKFMILPRRKV